MDLKEACSYVISWLKIQIILNYTLIFKDDFLILQYDFDPDILTQFEITILISVFWHVSGFESEIQTMVSFPVFIFVILTLNIILILIQIVWF